MFEKLYGLTPTDGWKAFVVASCACLVQTIIFGIAISFGSFSNSLHLDERLGNPSKTQVAIAGSFATGVGPVIGIFSGIAVAKLGSRITCMFASVCTTLSMVLSALLANSVVTLVLTYSLFIALGGFMIAAGATATSTWFVKRKALGMGINFSGGGLGSLTIPYIAGTLQSKYDWRTCFLILSSFTAVSFICSFLVCLRPEPEKEAEEETNENEVKNEEEPNETHRSTLPVTASENDNEVIPITDWRAARHEREFSPMELLQHVILTKDFIVLFLLFSLFTVGLYAMLYSAVPYASSMGKAGTIYADAPALTIDRAVTVFIAYGAAMIVGGPVLGYIASVHLGDKLVCTLSLALYSVLFLVWIACRELWQHMILMGLMGMCVSGFLSTYHSMVGHKFHGPNLAVVMGIQFVSKAVGGFSGAPLATALTEANNGEYTTAFIVVAVVILFATLVVIFGIDCDVVPCGGKSEEEQSHTIDNDDGSPNEPTSS